MYAAKLPVGRM